jgi:sec-independent protein translocase protein TatA
MEWIPTAFLGASIGGGEWLLILFVFLLLFGPKKLPAMARSLGRTMAELRRASRDVQNELMVADLDPPPETPRARKDLALPIPDDPTAEDAHRPLPPEKTNAPVAP